MEKILIAASMALSLTGPAFAAAEPPPSPVSGWDCAFRQVRETADEVAPEWDTRCRVRIEEREVGNDGKLAIRPVELKVECTNGFRLHDESAWELFRENGIFNWGIQRENTAVVGIDALPAPGVSQPPSREGIESNLTISFDSRRKEDAMRLDGRCRYFDTTPEGLE